MSKEITEPVDTSMLSPERQAILERAKPKPRAPRPPELRLYNTMMDVPGVERGEFFTETYNPETKKNEVVPIGSNPKIVMLHRLCSYSYYSDKAKRLVAWTSEIDFANPSTVYLFRNDGQGAFVEKQGTYNDVKRHMAEKYVAIIEGESRKLMKFTNVLYVLYEGKVYRMFVSNASAAGVLPDGTNADFKNPLPGSLLKCWEDMGCNLAQVPFAHVCQLGSSKIEGKKQFYLMTFTPAGPVDDFPAMIDMYGELERNLALLLRLDIERMGVASLATEATPVPAVDMSAYSSDINPDDLPF